jgi:hypothetical protein
MKRRQKWGIFPKRFSGYLFGTLREIRLELAGITRFATTRNPD